MRAGLILTTLAWALACAAWARACGAQDDPLGGPHVLVQSIVPGGARERVVLARQLQAEERGPSAGITWAELARLWGVSFCGPGGAASFVRAGLAPIDRAATEAHEATHRAQYARWGCDSLAALRRSALGRLTVEAEAYAAGWCAAIRAGGDSLAWTEGSLARLREILGEWPPAESARLARLAWDRVAHCGRNP